MDKTTLQELAELRLRDVEVLLDAGRWDAAYYLAGHCVECSLKACAALRFKEHVVPEKDLVAKFYTHRLRDLLELAGLGAELERRQKTDGAFRYNWNVVSAWHETKRYDINMPEEDARAMYLAVSDEESGVLSLLRTQY